MYIGKHVDTNNTIEGAVGKRTLVTFHVRCPYPVQAMRSSAENRRVEVYSKDVRFLACLEGFAEKSRTAAEVQNAASQ
jgi:hypothetical protein